VVLTVATCIRYPGPDTRKPAARCWRRVHCGPARLQPPALHWRRGTVAACRRYPEPDTRYPVPGTRYPESNAVAGCRLPVAGCWCRLPARARRAARSAPCSRIVGLAHTPSPPPLVRPAPVPDVTWTLRSLCSLSRLVSGTLKPIPGSRQLDAGCAASTAALHGFSPRLCTGGAEPSPHAGGTRNPIPGPRKPIPGSRHLDAACVASTAALHGFSPGSALAALNRRGMQAVPGTRYPVPGIKCGCRLPVAGCPFPARARRAARSAPCSRIVRVRAPRSSLLFDDLDDEAVRRPNQRRSFGPQGVRSTGRL
jgi:hypothetical protein